MSLQIAAENSAGPLSVAHYDAAEAAGRARLPNRVVEAFEPVTFGAVGYPTRVMGDDELWKFADVMHERRFEQDFLGLPDGLTEDEFRLFKEVNKAVAGLGESRFARSMVARGSLLRALNVLRHIRYVYGDRRPPILEVGCGSGYLGALLILEGYPFIGNDVTQGFYLFQNLLWTELAPNGVRELALESTPMHALNTPAPGEVVHVPWWAFYDPSFALSRLGIGIVSCNHAICEMHPRSLYYLLLLSRQVMGRSEQLPSFLFEGWGTDINLPAWYVNSRFYRYGLVMCHNDGGISAYAEADKVSNFAAFPQFNMTNFDSASQARAYGETEVGAIWEPHGFQSPQNEISGRILEGRQQLDRSVAFSDVAAEISRLTGISNYETEDETFWSLVDVR